MKKTIVKVALTAATLAALGVTASAEGRKIGYTCMDGTNPFFVALENSIKEVVEANGDELVSMDPANDSNKQIDQIEDMISKGVELCFVNPVDADGIIPGLDMLKEADIPMFGFDTQVGDMSYLVSYAGSDNYNAGYVCGKDLAEKIPEGGDIPGCGDTPGCGDVPGCGQTDIQRTLWLRGDYAGNINLGRLDRLQNKLYLWIKPG